MKSFIVSTLAAFVAAQETPNYGMVIRDALESINVDVDGMVEFLDDKNSELE